MRCVLLCLETITPGVVIRQGNNSGGCKIETCGFWWRSTTTLPRWVVFSLYFGRGWIEWTKPGNQTLRAALSRHLRNARVSKYGTWMLLISTHRSGCKYYTYKRSVLKNTRNGIYVSGQKCIYRIPLTCIPGIWLIFHLLSIWQCEAIISSIPFT